MIILYELYKININKYKLIYQIIITIFKDYNTYIADIMKCGDRNSGDTVKVYQ